MRSSRRKLVVAFSALATVCACRGDADTVASSYGDYDPATPPSLIPVASAVPLTDPALFLWGGRYWVFSTGSGISVRSSTDLITFRQEAPVFAANPAWIAEKLPQVTDLWSPELRVFGGQIHLYYAASTFASGKSCIGHATTTSLDVPFVDRGSIICSNLTGTSDPYDAIDPTVLLNAPDDPWLAFGSWGAGIQLVALDASGNRRDNQILTIAARPNNSGIQASFLYKWRDYVYLFVSFDSTTSHSIHVGRAKQIAGPYVDRDGTAMLKGGGTLLLSGDNRFKGPGSNSILDDGSRHLMAFHAYDSEQNNAAVLRLAPLVFDNDGWPVTAGP